MRSLMSIAGMKLSGMLSVGLETVYEYRKHNDCISERFPGRVASFREFY